MSGQPPKVNDMLRRRLTLVAEVSALNAEGLKLSQALAGIEMEVLRCELAIERGEPDAQLVQELHHANESVASITQARAECEERNAAVEEKISALDVAIAASITD